MKLLYVSCHSTLEYDELKLFHEMGIDVFSHGAYCDPRDNSGDPKRPPLDMPFYPELHALAKATPKEAIAPELFEWADVILFMGMSHWVVKNWAQLQAGRKRVIWRSIGQSTPAIEKELALYMGKGLEIVRYSPIEREIPHYAGDGTLVRFYKDEEELGSWTGERSCVISVGQMVKHRDHYCGLTWFERATEDLPRLMIGPHNEDISTMPSALLSYDELKAALRENRAFFYTGTYPAPYTLGFVEAWIAGIPVVAIGHKLRDYHFPGAPGSYEIPRLLDGRNGFCSDDIGQLHDMCETLLGDLGAAREMGQAGRAAAIPLFGKQAAIFAWREALCYQK